MVALHVGVQTPCTQSSLPAHWVLSAHWLAGAVQTAFKHFEPAPRPEHSLSEKQPLYGPGPASLPLFATHEAVPLFSVHV